MAIQHVNILDADRHEAKGASTALSNQALFGNGSGGSEFRQVSYSDLTGAPTFTADLVTELESSSSTNQMTFGANSEEQVVFGGATTTANLDLDAAGNLTFNSTGTYIITATLAAGKSSGSGVDLFVMQKLNSAQFGPVTVTRVDSANSSIPVNFQTTINATVGDVYSVYMLKDSSGSIGLLTRAIPTVTGWPATSEVAYLRVDVFSGTL